MLATTNINKSAFLMRLCGRKSRRFYMSKMFINFSNYYIWHHKCARVSQKHFFNFTGFIALFVHGE